MYAAVFLLCFVSSTTFCQKENVLSLVNPFIGTAKSNVYTRWGNECGTYPGAVAPWGAVQLTPETRSNGYDYKDSSIRCFSCFGHHSGFPGGSGGRVYIMPVSGIYSKEYGTGFHHANEKAKPGYYAVTLDNSIVVEATATTHTGLFRITFPRNAVPAVMIDNGGEISLSSSHVIKASSSNTILHFDRAITDTQRTEGAFLVKFAAAESSTTIINIQLSASPVGYESAQQNIDAETAASSFDDVRHVTQQQWEKELSLVSITDTSVENKTIFYTALYHSLLLPWIVSDVNGAYLGSDHKVHKTNGTHEYGGFSPWDTFRSLHPLLSLLYPGRQSDMMLSMMDVYEQSGYLPVESMTGNHSIPILVDSYLKGIKPIDSSLLYKAMKKSIVEGPFLQNDMALYQQGFIPYPHTESVTRTVEYAYDDWALAQYARKIMKDDSLYEKLMQRSRNYQNLFDEDELSLLPRKDSTLYYGTANAGYKEGDQWVYTLFLPQYQRDLINRMGGDENFVQQVEKEFTDNRLVFDNETMFHVPYLFNSTAYSYKTQQWVTNVRRRFSATPGGFPGNDDLGATSSWYVWSALGLYPVCPGNPVYAIGTPLFAKATLSLPNGKPLIIEVNGISSTHVYAKQTVLNGTVYSDKWLSHQDISGGGAISFSMTDNPDTSLQMDAMPGEVDTASDITVSDVIVHKKSVLPDEPFWIHYNLHNSGGSGTSITKLHVDDSITLTKNTFVSKGAIKRDSILCRLYAYGNHVIRLANLQPVSIMVLPSAQNKNPFISTLQVSPVVKVGSFLYDNYTVMNKSGLTKTFVLPVKMNGKVLRYDTVKLKAGDSTVLYHKTKMMSDGLSKISILNKSATAKVYDSATYALVLNIPDEVMGKRIVHDVSGFDNNGQLSSFGNYIELPHTPSLDSNGTTLTMMEWVYDTGTHKSLTELLAKGDNHVLQLVDGSSLTFFAGGWGRGDCTVPLPVDWRNHWHHIAGVCNGKDLRVYVDGELKGVTPVEEVINLDVAARWTIGSNEEFPLNRTFTGKIKGVKIFASPLSSQDVISIYRKEKIKQQDMR